MFFYVLLFSSLNFLFIIQSETNLGGGGLETDTSATSFGGTQTKLLEFSSLCTGSS